MKDYLVKSLSGSAKRKARTRWAAACISALSIFAGSIALAQSVSPDLLRSVSPEMLRAIQQGQADGTADDNSLDPTVRTYAPQRSQNDQDPPSHLEQLYLRRSGEILKQFGYDVLGEPSTISINQQGALSDRYVLGVGDDLVVTFRGQENSTYRVRINRDGTITLPRLSPMLSAGRSFGEFRADLEAQVAQTFVSTKVFVTLGAIHQMSVLVSGEVRSPGQRIVSGLANPLDVILLSGGIKKSGSLRSIRISGSWGTRIVDLYSVIAQGGSRDLGPLRDGDTVYVPPVALTAAVAGAVTRPGIYELTSASRGTPAAALLRLAGGVEIAGTYNLAKIGLLPNGRLSLMPTTGSALVRSGEILVVLANHTSAEGRISLRGAVAAAGMYPLSVNATASDLFHAASDLSYDGYAPFAIILRRDPVTNAVTIVPFSVAGAIRKSSTVPLRSEDLVFVLTRAQIASLTSFVTRSVNAAYSRSGAPSSLAVENDNSGRPDPSGIRSGAASGSNYSRSMEALPPGTEPLFDDTATGGTYPGGSAPANGGLGAVPPNGGSTYGPGASAGSLANDLDANDPRYRGTTQNDSSESAALAQARALANRNGSLNHSTPLTTMSDSEVVNQLARLLHVSDDALLRTASDNLVWILDDVREPGPYLGAPGTSLADMLLAAGGVQQSADLSSIEVTSTEIDQMRGMSHTVRSNYSGDAGQLSAVATRPLDVVRVRPVYSDRQDGTVTVDGQVRYPGVFDITRDEHLSALIKRAGGMSDVAYPYGAIFTRRDAAITEREGNERSARELENEVPTLMLTQRSQSADLASAGAYLTSLARNLREEPVLGRIVITADPDELAAKPELDFVLQPGDTLFIPKRPSTVTVSGEVLNPGAIQYRSGLSFSDYVKFAGGATQSADEDRTFIIYPDGSSAPIESGWFAFGGGRDIPPGSTIVVPRDLRPFSWSDFLKDVTQITSQLAVTAASLSILSQN